VEVPPVEDEVSVLHREAEEAMKRVHRLKSRQQDALREHERLGAEIKDAEKAASEACARLRARKPAPPLPPVPSFKECLAMARAQRPDSGSRNRADGSTPTRNHE
jgi:hypothetical protein